MKAHYSFSNTMFLLFTATSISALSVPSASAQDQTATDGQIEDIVVTARRREESLQDTPISVTAFSAAALQERQVTTVADIGNFTPNLIADSAAALAGSSATVTLFIRGVGQNDFNLTIDPGVGLYLDGVYVSRSVGALLDTVDLERVEVLRGPQGTLFGKNTIGGALVLTTAQPDDEFAGTLEATTGRYNRFDLRGSLNVPVTDRLAIRATASLQTRDGYVRRLADGDRMGNRDSLSGRLLARWEATDDVTFTLAVDGTRNREEAKPATLLNVNPLAEFVAFNNFAVNGSSCFTPPAGLPVPDNAPCFNDRFITGDPYTTFATGPNFSNLDLWGVSLTSEWALGGGVTFKTITAYRDLKSSFQQDYDNSPLAIGETANDYTQDQFSQELQLTGTSLNDRLNWLIGLFYLREEGFDRNELTFSIADFVSGGAVKNDSYAAFTQLTYKFTDRLSLTLGGRYTWETKRFLPDQFIVTDRTGGGLLALSQLFIPTGNPNGNLILPRVEASTKIEEFTPAATLDYRFSDEVLGYVSYSKGFKSGGFTQRVFPPEPVVPDFGPEFVESYELGFKSDLFDRRVRLNGAVFYADYTGLQIIVNDGVAPKVRNAGKARIKGFELEMEAAVTRGLRLSGGIGYTDAEYRSVDPRAVGITEANSFSNVPKWTATVGASLTLLEIEMGTLSTRGDWAYRSAHFKDALNTPDIRQSGYSIVNASMSFETDAWTLTAGATNLLDKQYLITGYSDVEAIGVSTGTFARPREWFLRGSVRF